MGKLLILILLLLTVACTTREAIPYPEACLENYTKRTAALKAKDWDALEVAAVKFIDGCDKAYGDEEFAKAHAELSLVLRQRNDPKNAAEFADRAVSYSEEPDFHIDKALCLMQQKNYIEAALELDVAELMSKLALKKNELRKIEWEPKDAPDYEKKKQNYENLLDSVKQARKVLVAVKTGTPRERPSMTSS